METKNLKRSSCDNHAIKDILCGAPRNKAALPGSSDFDVEVKSEGLHRMALGVSYSEGSTMMDDIILSAFYSATQIMGPNADLNAFTLYISGVLRQVFGPHYSELNFVELAAKIHLLVRGYFHHGLTLRMFPAGDRHETRGNIEQSDRTNGIDDNSKM